VLAEGSVEAVETVEGAVGETENVELVWPDAAWDAGGRSDDLEAQPETKAIARRSAVRFRMSNEG
jgi:hypothetical protein